MADETFELAGETLASRLLLGTARYPSPEVLRRAIRAAECEVVTVSLRREGPEGRSGEGFWRLLRELGVRVLPNTAGCRTADEALTTARMAREIFDTAWIKLEVIGDEHTLQPDPFGLVDAARTLVDDGFEVFPYTTEDLVLAQRLVDAGCRILMPWGSPIGSGQGLRNPRALETLRARFPEETLIVDAGIGRPSDAVQALEMGYDAVLVNTAVAEAADPEQMAAAFAHAVRAGRLAHHARPIAPRDTAQASTPLVDTPFWHQR